MGEALPGGHEMLNHLGKMIRVTRRTLRSLDMRNYLRRDHRSSFLRLRPEYYPVFKELGADCLGPNVPMCRCRQCSGKVADLDHMRLPDEYRRVKTDELIRAVKAKKRRR
jgi:hypothetical protein